MPDLRPTAAQAVADLIAQAQVRIQAGMARVGWTEADLAAAMGLSKAQVETILGEKAKLSLETIALAFHALGDVAEVTSANTIQHQAAYAQPKAPRYIVMSMRDGAPWGPADCPAPSALHTIEEVVASIQSEATASVRETAQTLSEIDAITDLPAAIEADALGEASVVIGLIPPQRVWVVDTDR